LGPSLTFGRINSGRRGALIASVQTSEDADQTGLLFAVRQDTPTSDDTLVEAVRITHAGNVGIGTSSPAAILDVSSGSSAFPSAIRIKNSTHATSRRAGLSLGDGTGPSWVVGTDIVGDGTDTFFLFDGTTGVNVERFRINNAGLITGTGTSLGAWTAYTPTVTAGSGTFTTVSASGWWCQIGKTVHVNTSITITTNGTAAGRCQFSLPVTASSNSTEWYGAGRESVVTGSALTVGALAGSATAIVHKYDNSYPGGDGYLLRCSLTYQVA